MKSRKQTKFSYQFISHLTINNLGKKCTNFRAFMYEDKGLKNFLKFININYFFSYSILISIEKMGCNYSFQNKQTQIYPDDGRRGRLTTIDCRKRSTKVMDVILENVTMISEKLKPEQIKYCMDKLSEHQLFNGLSISQLEIVCTQMVWMKGLQNQYLFQQGETGHSFFLIEKGQVGVEVDGIKVAQLGEGQSFGELALLFKASRSASIKCLSETNTFFVMKPAIYRSILQQLKTAEYARNKSIIDKISLFHCLTNKQKYNLANAIKIAIFKAGEVIFQVGEVSQGLYIVSEGEVQISITGKNPLSVGELEMFGESALKDNGRRQGQAKCKINTTCMVIGKKDIENTLSSNYHNLLYFNIQKWAIIRTQKFKQYNNLQLNNIIMGFESIFKGKGEQMIGSQFRGLVISLEGTINKQPQGTLFNMKVWQQGNNQGQDLVKDDPGYIGYLSFEKLNQIVESIESKRKLMKASQKCIPDRDSKLTLQDFDLIKKLGEGQFGQVFLIKNKQTGGGLYAVKCLSKKSVKEEQMQLSVIEERKILQKAVFPFIVGFVRAFHDQNNIFLLMQYLRGKEMFDVIRQMPSLNKPIARYYFGRLMLSIEYLHANNIIYRDVKPENSVVDHRGKVYLIDLGTAKELFSSNMFKTFTIIGTPHYMAPEVFEGKGYSFQSDYWSLGILLYQFVCGKLPFGENHHGDPYSLYAIIKKTKIEFPKHINDEKVKKLINFLLVKDPKIRTQQVTFQRIKKHEYYQGFSWQDLLDDRTTPPYVPRDFRLGVKDNHETCGQPFLKHLYKGKDYGKLEDWNEKIGF